MLYYTVTHNVSGNSSELAFNTTTNEAVLNEARYGETYFISVCAVNLIGKGLSTVTTLIIDGKIIVHVIITRIIFYIYFAVSSSSIASTTTKSYDMVSSMAFSTARLNGTQVFGEYKYNPCMVITIFV